VRHREVESGIHEPEPSLWFGVGSGAVWDRRVGAEPPSSREIRGVNPLTDEVVRCTRGVG
jgi:hypothetical protein